MYDPPHCSDTPQPLCSGPLGAFDLHSQLTTVDRMAEIAMEVLNIYRTVLDEDTGWNCQGHGREDMRR